MNDKPFFILFANCIPVKGVTRSTICDLQLGRIIAVPNFVFSFFENSRRLKITLQQENYPENFETISQFIEFLEKDGWGFWTDQPELYPELSLNWDYPSIITNCIIDFDKNSSHNFEKIFKELFDIRCTALQFRSFDFLKASQLEIILGLTKDSSLNSIELILMYQPEFDEARVKKICSINRRITRFILHSAPIIKGVKMEESGLADIYYTNEVIDSSNHCGIISPSFFSPNIATFSEAKNFNSCLNRKLGIDTKGNLKNCPSMNESFGNINDTSILSAIGKSGFKKSWSITKDLISICKDCEFRYICTDCRGFLTNENDPFSKPLKCNYDPYTTIWAD